MSLAQEIGLRIPHILLPKPSIDHHKWAVIACDQFTSEPEYWQRVEDIVGDAPSTYHMILPEVYLDTDEEEKRLTSTHKTMKDYLKSGLFRSLNDMIYVLRTVNGHTRRGLMVCLDLEQYDFHKGAKTPIRATEGTILDRLPPRIRIRKAAPLECPHILVLFDDPNDTVIGPLDEQVMHFEEVYDFDLMLDSGHLTGLAVNDEEVHLQIMQALKNLIDPETFAEKYNLKPEMHQPLLFAMGDGNHSLATAKAIWEEIKPEVGMNHPARYALVEIENIHDPALAFEPIHRLLFNLNQDILKKMADFWGDQLKTKTVESLDSLMKIVDKAEESWHQIGMICPDGLKLLEIHHPHHNLPVGTLQEFLDSFLAEDGAENIDYVHGTQVLLDKGKAPGNVGFYVPALDKSDLFKTVILDGALPRKTFSMGEAKEKRFYMECRRIQS
ncbi:MAG: DUF1015 domain-containing protein [Chloroflexota bacterium]|jgi:hypothetical protein|nr:DUF1015 domain-containing protein [Chloroflexota bacterium]